MINLLLFGVGILLTDSNDRGNRIMGWVMMSAAALDAVLYIWSKMMI